MSPLTVSNTVSSQRRTKKVKTVGGIKPPDVHPNSALPGQIEWNPDPNEPRYCLCNEVSYGEMIGCDNGDCSIEWFHYACVGLNSAPKGKWYCPHCTATMKRRGRKN